jgi:uncharacterized repeat protein (TIGR01451 family)
MSVKRIFSTTFVACGTLLGVLALMVTSAMAVTDAPAWRISSVAIPTAFSANDTTFLPNKAECAPCDKYQLRLTNVGGSPSNGEPVEVTDTLPEGVTTSNHTAGSGQGAWQCTPEGEGLPVVECTFAGVVGAVREAPALTVYVKVDPSVPADSTRPNSVRVEGGGAATVQASDQTLLNPAAPLPFGFGDLSSYLTDLAGAPDTQAADHPNSLTTSFDVTSAIAYGNANFGNPTLPPEAVNDVVVDLPAGFVGDPQATQQCTLSSLVLNAEISACPAASQVGRISFSGKGFYEREFFEEGRENIPVYNMVPEHGFPAEFGFDFAGFPLTMYASVVGSGAETHGRVTIPGVPAPTVVGFEGAVVTFFGNPTVQDGLPSSPVAFFTNPSDCSGEPLVTSIHVDSWEHPGRRNSDGTPDFSDPAWKSATTTTPAVEGCQALHFNPRISLTPDTAQVDSPTGLGVELDLPQTSDPSVLASADLKDAVVTLPVGMSVSPSAADGLWACSPEQVALGSNTSSSCPASSTLGTVEITTPLLASPLQGHVYLAQPKCGGEGQPECTEADATNGNLFGLYLEAEGSGVVIKLPGRVSANPTTGQITTTFKENPQLPFSDLKIHLNGGERAPLANPQSCGTFTTTTDLTSWSAPVTPDATPSSSFPVTGCASPMAFAPSFSAGSITPAAGGFSPFTLTFSRNDGEQNLSGVSVTTPPGLVGMISQVPLCEEAQANAGTCPEASKIGTTTVAAGAGSHPLWISGKVYLTGPYNGAPFGLSVVVPAKAGPFNLGNVIVRSAINVDPTTSALTVTSAPLPQIKDGVPFRLKTVNVTIDRPGFMLNPTNCEQHSITATIAAAQGARASVSSTFAVAGCASLSFKPSFTASTQAKTSKADGARLDVKVSYPASDQANIRSVKVDLPKALPSRLTTLQKACAGAVFEANPARCPAESIVGIVRAHTPVLPVTLTGPAYLVSHGGEAFPNLVVILQGEGVRVDLTGYTFIKKGVTSSTFRSIPDVPVSSFELYLPEGKYSALTANGNLCKQKLQMPTKIIGQNGAVIKQTTTIKVTGCPKAKQAIKKKRLKKASHARKSSHGQGGTN